MEICMSWLTTTKGICHSSKHKWEAQINQHFSLKLQTNLAENRTRQAAWWVTLTGRNKHATCACWPSVDVLKLRHSMSVFGFFMNDCGRSKCSVHQWLWWWKEHINLSDNQTVFVLTNICPFANKLETNTNYMQICGQLSVPASFSQAISLLCHEETKLQGSAAMCEITSESKQLQLSDSLKSLIIWQSMETFPHSAIQLMRVRHRYFNKITSACFPLVLRGRACAASWDEAQHTSKGLQRMDFCRGSAEVRLYWLEELLDGSLGNITVRLMSLNTCLVREILKLQPGHLSSNHMTRMPKSLPSFPSWDLCHPFDFIWFAVCGRGPWILHHGRELLWEQRCCVWGTSQNSLI